jgi:hypothetical protein
MAGATSREYRTSVHTKYLVIDDDRESEEIEHVGEVRPDFGRSVLPNALGVKSIRLTKPVFSKYTVGSRHRRKHALELQPVIRDCLESVALGRDIATSSTSIVI